MKNLILIEKLNLLILTKKPKTIDILERFDGNCIVNMLIINYTETGLQKSICVPFGEVEDENGIMIDYSECSTAKIDENGFVSVKMGDLSEYLPKYNSIK